MKEMRSAKQAALTAAEIAALVHGELHGEADARYTALAAVAQAGPQQVAFFRSAADTRGVAPGADKLQAVLDCDAGLLLVDPSFPEVERSLIRVGDPTLAAALLQQHWCGSGCAIASGIHPTATVAGSAEVDPTVAVAAGVVIGEDCVLAAGVTLHAGVVLYPRVHVDVGTIIHANTVVGSPGFGYVWDGKRHQPMPQMGGVRIGRGVEIGANSTIDAGTLQPTVIGDGCIIDNQVQIGHNCELGRAVVLCAQVGLSGSTILEDGVVMGGQSGSGGHLRAGAGTQVAARGGLTADVGAGKVVGGVPAVDIRLHQRMQAALRRLARGRKS